VRLGAPGNSDEGSSRSVEPIRKGSLADAVSDRVPEGPGIGLEWDEEAVSRFLIR
jgi:hypothetical protein